MNRAGHLFEFSRVRGRSSHFFAATLVSMFCLTQSQCPQGMTLDLEGPDWAAFDKGRIADWAAQLPVGEAKREGIVGFAIV